MNYCGRFAPSATGPLHLGSIFAALISYLDAAFNRGRWLIRIDDLDETRCRNVYVDQVLTCLKAFGLQSSRPVVYQTDRISKYKSAFSALDELGILYSCDCSRKKLPKGFYPGFCRHRMGEPLLDKMATRINSAEANACVDDLIIGSHQTDPLSDFIIKRRDGLFAYQLACAIDEQIDGITHVIRGIDLLSSTPIQCLIAKKLGYTNPKYGHFPVLVGPDNSKLSKQTFAEPVNWETPGQTYAQLASLLLLKNTPDTIESAESWLSYFSTLGNPRALISSTYQTDTFPL